MQRKVIAIDLDDTVAELLPVWIAEVNKHEGDNVKKITDWNVAKQFKCGKRAFDYLTYDVFRNLPVKPHSQEVIKELQEHYDIYFVSSATTIPNSLVAKVEWVQEHFPFIPLNNIVLCGDKSVIRADIMIDDGVHNLETFTGDTKILMDCTHNQNETRFYRAHDWLEIQEKLLGGRIT